MCNNFDENAASWDDKPGRIVLSKKVWKIISDYLGKSELDQVLDYGCGTGLLGFQAAEIFSLCLDFNLIIFDCDVNWFLCFTFNNYQIITSIPKFWT